MAAPRKRERISWFPVPTKRAAGTEIAALWDKAEEKLGFVPNVMKVYAYKPRRFLRWWAHYDELMRGDSGLSKAQREMIAVVVSTTNRCHYCVVSHSAALRVLTGDAQLVDQVAVNYRHAPISERERAMLDLAVKVTEASYRVSPDDYEPLLRAGWTEADVWDVVEVAAMFNFTNRLASSLGWAPNGLYGSMGRPPDSFAKP